MGYLGNNKQTCTYFHLSNCDRFHKFLCYNIFLLLHHTLNINLLTYDSLRNLLQVIIFIIVNKWENKNETNNKIENFKTGQTYMYAYTL